MSWTSVFLDNPVEFMEANIVFPPPSAKIFSGGKWDTIVGGLGKFQLVEQKGVVWAVNDGGVLKRRGWGKVFALCDAFKKQDKGIFEAYWCPYGRNKTYQVMLGSDAELMFTPEMSGCSLGIGSATKTGDRLVMHSNFVKILDAGEFTAVGAQQVQSDAQEWQLDHAFAGHQENFPTVVSPKHYRTGGNGVLSGQATTVGVRSGNGWKFYALTFTVLGRNVYLHHGVKQVF